MISDSKISPHMETPNRIRPVIASNLRSYIELEIRNLILRGEFKPGERLVESEIAEQMEISRTPLREVFSALEREGLVVNIPRRGNFVVDFTSDDIEEIYSLRLLLEVGAIKRGVSRLTQKDIDYMQSLLDQLGKIVLITGKDEQITELDLAFHEHICICAGHTRLLNTWRSMSMQTRMLIGVTSQTYFQSPESPKVIHQRILDAIVRRDVGAAEEMLVEHFLDAQSRAQDGIQSLHSKK